MTDLHARVAQARRQLKAAGVPDDEADLDARLLAQHVLGWDAARFLADGRDPPPPGFDHTFASLVARRAAREPFAYIVGHREFWNLDFEVSPAVLVPRPETELVVEAALERLPAARKARVADVCTGSGCIAIALARERPDVDVVAADLSEAALDIARRNADRHGVSRRVALIQTDLLSKVNGTFDLVTSNPPYVSESDFQGLQPEIRSHEPRTALIAGPDGLGVIRRLVDQSAEHLVPGGTFIMEFGEGQSDEVERLISRAGTFRMIALRRDLQGIPRIAIAERTSTDAHHG